MGLTHLSLFSGIGGLDLAAEMAGFQTVGQCEWAEYPTKVLEKHWPDVPKWRDIQTLTGASFYERTGLRTVDVISGGFPCQPFSVAGKRRGKEDDRYLWPEMLRVIKELRPAWVVGENVAGIVNMALDTVLSDLETIGYSSRAFIIPACGVDAPHRRYRCAIVAWNNDRFTDRRESFFAVAGTKKRENSQSCGICEDVPDTDIAGLQGRNSAELPERSSERTIGACGAYVANSEEECGNRPQQCTEPARESRSAKYGWWQAEPDVGRVANGVPSRVDRLKCLGNAVVPQQFYPVFKAIAIIAGNKEK